MVLVSLVTTTPFKLIDASWAATTCLLALLAEVSKVDNPLSNSSSVTVNLNALFSPVSELTISENVPSPLSVTVALTPSNADNVSANPFKVLFAAETDTFCDARLLFIENSFSVQLPKSIAILPKFISAFLLENPENSNV